MKALIHICTHCSLSYLRMFCVHSCVHISLYMYVLTFSNITADVGDSNCDPLPGNTLLLFSFAFFLSFLLEGFVST